MKKHTFTILIGSFARGTGGENSDLDILRIGHTKSVIKPDNISKAIPISYIDYDYSVFLDLFEQGSLFLYHAFKEGVLLNGEEGKWEQFKEKFVVTNDHTDSIREYISLLEFIDEYPEYELSFIPFLSNIFKAVKNIGIFKLAENGEYIFDKELALMQGCGLNLSQAKIFISANNSFERSLQLTEDKQDIHKAFALEWKRQQKQFIHRITHDY